MQAPQMQVVESPAAPKPPLPSTLPSSSSLSAFKPSSPPPLPSTSAGEPVPPQADLTRETKEELKAVIKADIKALVKAEINAQLRTEILRAEILRKADLREEILAACQEDTKDLREEIYDDILQEVRREMHLLRKEIQELRLEVHGYWNGWR
jgi:hypothetical protein